MEALDFDYSKVLIWVIPGVFIALFRSFALRGSFPTIGKDDLAALVLGSVVFHFVSTSIIPNIFVTYLASLSMAGLFWIGAIVVIPSAVGISLGLFEASDWAGTKLRGAGFQIPTPTATAWDTMFRTLPVNTILIITLKDAEAQVFGRWVSGSSKSSASTDATKADLFLGEIGSLDAQNRYVPHEPSRGVYIAADLIRSIEIVRI